MPVGLPPGEGGGKTPWFCHGIECPPYSVVLSNASATPGARVPHAHRRQPLRAASRRGIAPRHARVPARVCRARSCAAPGLSSLGTAPLPRGAVGLNEPRIFDRAVSAGAASRPDACQRVQGVPADRVTFRVRPGARSDARRRSFSNASLPVCPCRPSTKAFVACFRIFKAPMTNKFRCACACESLHASVCAFMCVRAGMHACVHACVRVRAEDEMCYVQRSVDACVCVCARARVCVQIEMTAPVLNRITPGQGPFCKSNLTLSFFVPLAFQAKVVSYTHTHTHTHTNTHTGVCV